MDKNRGLFEDLKQRQVFRAAGLYLVVAWLLLQVRRHMEAANRQVSLSGFQPGQARLVKYITGESQDAERVIAPHPKPSPNLSPAGRC